MYCDHKYDLTFSVLQYVLESLHRNLVRLVSYNLMANTFLLFHCCESSTWLGFRIVECYRRHLIRQVWSDQHFFLFIFFHSQTVSREKRYSTFLLCSTRKDLKSYSVLLKWELFIKMRAACFAPSFLQKRGVLEWGWLLVGSFHFNEKFSLY